MPPSRQISFSQPDPSHPSLSPTLDAAPSPPRAPVRRNLFSAHLSRRPASSQSSHPPNSQSNSQTQRQAHPLFAPPTPQRSASQTSPFASPPQLHPSFSSSYDPTISPNHPLSPKTREAVFAAGGAGGGVVAVHPVTGRPILPDIPTLPRHLRLSDDDEEDEDDEGEDGGDVEEGHADPEAHGNDDVDIDTDDEQHHARAPSVHPYNQAGHDPFASAASQLHHAQPPPAGQHQPPPQQPPSHPHYINPATSELDAELFEKARYNSQLEDMMSRYRSREFARHHPKSSKGGGKIENGMEAADEEKEELMGHLMGTLRGVVRREIEEEGWMFGDGCGMGSGDVMSSSEAEAIVMVGGGGQMSVGAGL